LLRNPAPLPGVWNLEVASPEFSIPNVLDSQSKDIANYLFLKESHQAKTMEKILATLEGKRRRSRTGNSTRWLQNREAPADRMVAGAF